MNTFGGIMTTLQADIVLCSIPYFGDLTWNKEFEPDSGYKQFIEASNYLELYDIETDSDVSKRGIVYDRITELEYTHSDRVHKKIYHEVLSSLKGRKLFHTFFGGDHSISIPIVQAYKEIYSDLTVLQLDAHADLRKTYNGSAYNHACSMNWALENTNLIQVGIRSMSEWESGIIDNSKAFCMRDVMILQRDWMYDSIRQLGENVYITLDIDVLDPSIMPATSTPEPGGFDWYTLINYLRKVFQRKNVVGFDIVEFIPLESRRDCEFTLAKLYYKMLSYKFELNK